MTATSPKKPIILVDGSSYLYRAFHAMPSLTNSKGVHTGAVYGVVNMLRKLIADYQPECMAVVFDAKGKTFRDDIFPQYKAHRPAMPVELQQQIQPLHAIIKALGLPLLCVEGVEADDVIGTLAKQASAQGEPILISTGDKDLAQLVDKHITLVNTMTNTVLDPAGVTEKFGIPPELIVDYLALIGDTSDNIPGVPQVGPKTAVKWLQEFGSLQNILEHAEKIKGKVGENLRASVAQIPMAKSLATIKIDLDLPLQHDALKRSEPDAETLIKLYQELEFKNWLGNLLGAQKATTAPAQETTAGYKTILTEAELAQWLKQLEQASLFAFHMETTSQDYMQARIVGFAFATAAKQAVYIPVAHDYLGAPKQLTYTQVLQQLQPILENPSIKKIGHNFKYTIEVLANQKITLRGMAHDSMLESYVLDSTASNHTLEALALKNLGTRTIKLEEIAGKGAKQVSFNQVPIEAATRYAAEIADTTLQLHQHLWERLEKETDAKYIYERIELPLVPVLASIERKGVLLDLALLKKQSVLLTKRLQELEQETHQLAGVHFNLNSPKQLQEILFEKFQLPVLQKTPTGQPSTADPVLQELALSYPLPKLIIEYRGLNKLITTYVDRLPEQVDPDTGRVHTSYQQAVTATGRLSSTDPNLQNIPIRMEEGRRIRQAFIAAPGYQLISADYSQIELRIMAHLSGDKGLLDAFNRDLDIHSATAAEVFGVPLEQVTGEQRRSAKAINFGLIYGMSAFGLAKQLGIDRHAGQTYIDRYFERYPGVKVYMERTRALAHQQGYVETLFGRRLYMPEINSSQMMRQKAAERAAINAPMQGTAADIIKRSMIKLDEALQASHLDASIIMQVHDELVIEAAEAIVPQVTDLIRQQMMAAAKLEVPLLVGIGIGNNWDAASSH